MVPLKRSAHKYRVNLLFYVWQKMLNHTAASTITIIRTNKFSKSSINHSQWRRMKPKASLCSRTCIWLVAAMGEQRTVWHLVRRTLCTRILAVCDVCEMCRCVVRVCVCVYAKCCLRSECLSGSNYYCYFSSKKQQKRLKNQIHSRDYMFEIELGIKFKCIILFRICIVSRSFSIIVFVIEHQFCCVLMSYRNE